MTQPVVLTMGDPAGIGPELALMAWRALGTEAPFALLGDAAYMTALGARMGVAITPVAAPADAAVAAARGLPVIDHPLPTQPVAGRPDPANAPAIVAIIERAVDLARTGAASAVCTGPINKKVLADGAGFAFPGHTEFLGSLCGAARPVMMLACPELRVVPVTVHVPLAAVPQTLTEDLLVGTLTVTARALQQDFAIANPRIAVSGLNPHAGEGGLMGEEEPRIIAPALERVRAALPSLRIHGPLPADTLFHPAARAGYDAALAMYHDQALVPIKTIAFDSAVNVTLGLDFVRTSPDHGTAYDIAGSFEATPASLVGALRMAAELGARRQRHR